MPQELVAKKSPKPVSKTTRGKQAANATQAEDDHKSQTGRQGVEATKATKQDRPTPKNMHPPMLKYVWGPYHKAKRALRTAMIPSPGPVLESTAPPPKLMKSCNIEGLVML